MKNEKLKIGNPGRKFLILNFKFLIKRGFTLIELLLTTAILAIITVAVVSTFAGGLRVYQRAQAYGGAQADVLISLEKMERDLRNVLDFSEIDFNGDTEEISFGSLIRVVDSEGYQNLSLGRIFYYFDAVKKKLITEEQDYSDAVLEIKKGRGRVKALASIEDIKFSYYYSDEDTQTYEWKDLWKIEETKDEERKTKDEEENRVPLGVKIEVTFKDDNRVVKLDRTIFIPTAVSKHKAQEETGESEE